MMGKLEHIKNYQEDPHQYTPQELARILLKRVNVEDDIGSMFIVGFTRDDRRFSYVCSANDSLVYKDLLWLCRKMEQDLLNAE
jgi:hypothetical protein